MDRTRLLKELAGQRAYCQGRSPLYAAVLAELEADATAPWIGRSVAWMLAAAAAFGARDMPFHLVELGASAGLNLVGGGRGPLAHRRGAGPSRAQMKRGRGR